MEKPTLYVNADDTLGVQNFDKDSEDILLETLRNLRHTKEKQIKSIDKGLMKSQKILLYLENTNRSIPFDQFDPNMRLYDLQRDTEKDIYILYQSITKLYKNIKTARVSDFVSYSDYVQSQIDFYRNARRKTSEFAITARELIEAVREEPPSWSNLTDHCPSQALKGLCGSLENDSDTSINQNESLDE